MGEPRPRLLILSFSRLASDPRVLRQIDLFGEEYALVTCGYGPAPAGSSDHIEIPAELGSWRGNQLITGLLLLLRRHHRLYFASPRVRLVLAELACRAPVDMVLANDVLAAPVALAAQPRGGVHADLHEYSPRQGRTRWWKALIGPLMDWACRAYVTRTDSQTTVAPGIAAEYARVYGLAPAVVPNAVPYRAELTPTDVHLPLRLVHIGVAGRGRRLEVMAQAVAAVNRAHPGRLCLDLILAPGEAGYITELRRYAQRPEVSGVRVLPPVDFTQIVPTLHRYDVGVFICPPTTFNLAHALPNKFFEFVQARLAVVVGPSVEMAPVVREHGLGVVTQGFDVDSVAAALADLTGADVTRYKDAAHAAAAELSAEVMVQPWRKAMAALARPR